MDDGNVGAPSELEPREPSDEDLVKLCRELNRLGARYLVVGGFAIRAAGHIRATTDIDFLVETSLENEARVFKALEVLPDQAVLELEPGEVERYTVVRVADEVVVDLIKSACGITFAEARKHMVTMPVNGVPIPFASPALLWHMKVHTRRAKDEGDLFFLREHFQRLGLDSPPSLEDAI